MFCVFITFNVFYGLVWFCRLFLIPGRFSLPFEGYVSGFPPDSVTLRCFLVFLQEFLFAFFGVLLPFGLSWPFAFLRFSDLPLASSDYFGFFPGYSVIWSSLPSLDFPVSVRISCSLLLGSCGFFASSCGFLAFLQDNFSSDFYLGFFLVSATF